MPTTTNFGISYQDYHEGYVEDFVTDGSQVTRPCILAWSDRANFKTAMLGYSVTDGKAIIRYTPEVHPDYGWLYASEVRFHSAKGKPLLNNNSTLVSYDAPGGASGSGQVLADVIYRALDYEVLQDNEIGVATGAEINRYVSRHEQYSLENLQVTGGSFKWSVGGQTIQEPLTKLFITKALLYTWWQVPAGAGGQIYSTLLSTINSSLGKVNSSAFDTNYPAGTLLFNGLDPQRTRCAEGQRAVNIVYSFLYRRDGWNTAYRAAGGSGPGFYDVVAADGTGLTPYTTTNLMSLFQIG